MLESLETPETRALLCRLASGAAEAKPALTGLENGWLAGRMGRVVRPTRPE
jgi:hypothetical protein